MWLLPIALLLCIYIWDIWCWKVNVKESLKHDQDQEHEKKSATIAKMQAIISKTDENMLHNYKIFNTNNYIFQGKNSRNDSGSWITDNH